LYVTYQICFIQRFFLPNTRNVKKQKNSCIKNLSHKKVDHMMLKEIFETNFRFIQKFSFFQIKKHSGFKTNHKSSYVLKIINGQILCVTTYTKHSYPSFKFWSDIFLTYLDLFFFEAVEIITCFTRVERTVGKIWIKIKQFLDILCLTF